MHGAKNFPSHRVYLAKTIVSTKVHVVRIHEVILFCETLSQTQGTLEVVQSRLQALEKQQPWMDIRLMA